MFEKAVRMKLRFGSPQGALSAEDLWDLPLTSTRANQANLNNVAKEINAQLKAAGEEDFVNPKPSTENILQLKLEIVKHVIKVRQDENEEVRAATAKREQKARILEIIAQKQDKELEGKSLDELKEMVAAL